MKVYNVCLYKMYTLKYTFKVCIFENIHAYLFSGGKQVPHTCSSQCYILAYFIYDRNEQHPKEWLNFEKMKALLPN